MAKRAATEAFDFVVVGAGTAGCVVARRLWEGGARVLVLEAGPVDKAREIHIPPAFVKLFQGDLDWAYFTEEEPHLLGRRLFWPRGRVVGGSGSINAMLYVRGHRADYDRWRRWGNEGWGYEEVLPYFRRSEDQQRGADDFHGVGGPLSVVDPRDPNPLSRVFLEATAELGWPANADFNGARQEGAGLFQLTQRRGKRWSTAAGFLRPALSGKGATPGVTLRTGVLVTRVLLEKGRAVGVEYQEGGDLRRAKVAEGGEVVLCGGAINSPQTLMLSGIGPAEPLAALGVQVRADLPGVGRNLQDHAVVSTIFRASRAITLDSAETLPNLLRYLLLRRGPFTSSVCEGGAFVRTRPGLEQPDLQFHFLPAALVDHGFGTATDQGFNFGPTLLKPQSRGWLALRSADPGDHPAIHANYLAEGEDLRVLIHGVRLARQLAHTEAFRPYLDREVLPGPAAESDEAITHFIRETLATIYHPVGTCKMGPDSDPEAVVDPQLRVRGVQGLRVVDASIMPELVGGNTNAPAIMIAEKGAESLLQCQR
jgi:choline dehydrogenase